MSRTEFNRTSLELVVEDLPVLEDINFSYTNVNDISALRKCRLRLKCLSMAGLKYPQYPAYSSDSVVSKLIIIQ